MSPQVSVVMPVYNAGSYLIDAVASIVNQSFQDWEMICVNDGSSDGSGACLDWFARQDPRIRVIHQSNAGIVAALNAGCQNSLAPLIMRMDADDIALPTRMDTQIEHLRAEPECIVCGSGILEIDADGDPLAESHLASAHDDIVAALLNRKTGHFHPTVMFRKSVWEAVGGYRPEFQWIEDHDLWLRLSEQGQLHNLDAVLLCYRMHEQSVCWQKSERQRTLMNRLMQDTHQRSSEAATSERPNDLPIKGPARTAHKSRSAAGPGKWARAAAKGGYPLSALKHLRRLNGSDRNWSYKVRMNIESWIRMGLHPRGLRANNRAEPAIPDLQTWHDRWQRSQAA